MPTSPPRQCAGCGAVVPSGRRCPCRAAWSGKSGASSRRNGSTRQSRRARALMLAEAPLCARQGTEWWWVGPAVPCRELATDDDHIVALSRGGDLHDPANHQGLCRGCHQVKSQAEAQTGHAGMH